jgi:hypothetical protein
VHLNGCCSAKVVPFAVATPIGCAVICFKTVAGPNCLTTLSVIVPLVGLCLRSSTVAQKLGKYSGSRTLGSVFFMVGARKRVCIATSRPAPARMSGTNHCATISQNTTVTHTHTQRERESGSGAMKARPTVTGAVTYVKKPGFQRF